MTGAVYIKKELIDKTLTVFPAQGKHLFEPLKSFAKERGVPLNILEDKEVTNEAEIHKSEGDLWHCIEGEVIFICGGELENPRAHKSPDEFKGSGITGGKEFVLKAGDWLWIPPGEAHQHKTSGMARLVITKIPSK